MKKFICVIAAIVMAMGILASCGADAKIKTKDIDWEVVEGFDTENDRKIVKFKYTNNSKYTISYLNIRMKLKPDVTKDDLEQFEYEDHFGDYELEDVCFYAESDEIVHPGETSQNGEFGRNNWFYYYVRDIKEYECATPDLMKIKYLDDNNTEHTLYYEFSSHKYFEE